MLLLRLRTLPANHRRQQSLANLQITRHPIFFLAQHTLSSMAKIDIKTIAGKSFMPLPARPGKKFLPLPSTLLFSTECATGSPIALFLASSPRVVMKNQPPSVATVLRNTNGSRSGQMIDCLRKNLLYSDKRMRDIFFRATRKLIGQHERDGTSEMLSRFTRELESTGRAWGTAEGVEANNWDMPAKAVVNTMVRAGVLFDQRSNPIQAGVGANAAAISAISESFEQRCEVFLIEFLIRKLGDVTVRDHKALAHALLRQFDPNIAIGDLEDHVVFLISHLESSVALTEDGLYTPIEIGFPTPSKAS